MRRFNKFFDSQKPDSPDQSDVDDDGSIAISRVPLLEIEPQNQVQFAHYGYVYCLLLGNLPQSSEQLLFSGIISEKRTNKVVEMEI
jgi:di- and tripeptidase